MPAASDSWVTSSRRCTSGCDVAHRNGGRGIRVQSADAHANIHGHDGSGRQHALRRRNAVDDFLVDRRAERLRESIEALERRRRALVRADELLRLAIQVLGAQSGPDNLAHHRERVMHDAPGACHGLDLARRLDRDHAGPTASRTRRATSSTLPTAGIRVTPPCASYQSMTGAVCSRYARRRLATAVGSSSARCSR